MVMNIVVFKRHALWHHLLGLQTYKHRLKHVVIDI